VATLAYNQSEEYAIICMHFNIPTPLVPIYKNSCPIPNKKVKVKLSLCLTKHHAMKTYWGRAGIAPRILDLDTRWG